MDVTVLAADNVTVAYESGGLPRKVVDAVGLAFRHETVSLLKGPSGSGKTTLLSALGGLLRPHGGRVLLHGEDLYQESRAKTAASRRAFGFVFQAPQLFPALTILENVRVPLDLRGVPAGVGRHRAAAMLESVGLADRAGARPRQLSGGEQQRVTIARALVACPEVILADEPTAALDAASGRQIGELLQHAAHDLGKTVVIVSHDERLMSIADRTVVLSDGRVEFDSEPRS